MRCARQLTNEEKSSFGMAVRMLRGNTVIRLLIILEIPTASESSISILLTEIAVKFLPLKNAESELLLLIHLKSINLFHVT